MNIKNKIKKYVFQLLRYSLYLAVKEQKLLELKAKLLEVVPDVSEQYTSFMIEGEFYTNKVYSIHAFQIYLAKEAIALLDREKRKQPIIVDIGDSSGAHIQYLQAVIEGEVRALSVNIDPLAVKKIRSKGLEAIESRAELVHEHPDFMREADIFLSYEMVEHLFDPISFLHNMSVKSACDYFVVTVPYLNQSRVGLHQVRQYDIPRNKAFNAETTHIFELSPNDWDLIFRFSGWEIVRSIRFTQYPKKHPLSLLRYLWRWFDFDGFYGVILRKDDTISKQYEDW